MGKVSKASRAQAKRWKKFRMAKLSKEIVEISDSEDQHIIEDQQILSGPTPIISPSQLPIMNHSDLNSTVDDSQSPEPPQSVVLQPSDLYWMPVDPDYLTEDDDMDPLDIPLYAQANIADSSDDEACNNQLVNDSLFPVFTRPFIHQPTLGKRKTKTGQTLTGYKKPRVQPDSKKLAPCEIPKETKRRYRLNRENALGKSNNVFDNWIIRHPDPSPAPSPAPSSPIPSESDDNCDNDFDGDQNQNNQNEITEAFVSNAWIDECVERYRSNKTKLSLPQKIKQAAQDRYDSLDADIRIIEEKYSDQSAKNPHFQYPSSIIDDLREFNLRQLELTISGEKEPGITASILTSASSIRRQALNPKSSTQPTSGVSRARKIRQQAANVSKFKELIFSQRGFASSHKSMLDDENLYNLLHSWAVSKKPGELTPLSLLQHVNNVALPDRGIKKTISINTANRWLHNLGFRAREYSKGLYYDGHERPDVVAYRHKYLEMIAELQKRSQAYHGDDLEHSIPPDPILLGDQKETVFLYHDESTVHANERPKRAWMKDNTQELRKKSDGRLIHDSDWITPATSTGRLEITSQDEHDQSPLPPFTDAAVVTYPGTKGDPWWDCMQLIDQVKNRAIPIFNYLFPKAQGVFIFDCSSAHESYGPTALRVSNMNLGPGGKKTALRETTIPTDDPRIPIERQGLPQPMVYPADHLDSKLAGKTKGIHCVLSERGLWDIYEAKAKEAGNKPVLHCAKCKLSSTKRDLAAREARLQRDKDAQEAFEKGEAPATSSIEDPDDPYCCASKMLSLQSDFANEKPLLQMVVEEAGHICLFLPKFHCELNPIELYWSYIKHYYRTNSFKCKNFKDSQALFEQIRKRCPVSTIRKYFRKVDRHMGIYRDGFTGVQAEKLAKNKKYRSHRCIARKAAMDFEFICNP